MSKKITLKSGATVTLKDPSELKVKDRKALMLASNSDSQAERSIAIGDALLKIIIEDWSFNLLIPSVRAESIDELDIPDYLELMKHTGEMTEIIFPDFRDTDDNIKNPDSPKENLTA